MSIFQDSLALFGDFFYDRWNPIISGKTKVHALWFLGHVFNWWIISMNWDVGLNLTILLNHGALWLNRAHACAPILVQVTCIIKKIFIEIFFLCFSWIFFFQFERSWFSCSSPSRFDWDGNARTWVYTQTKADLLQLFESELEQPCGQPINLSKATGKSATFHGFNWLFLLSSDVFCTYLSSFPIFWFFIYKICIIIGFLRNIQIHCRFSSRLYLCTLQLEHFFPSEKEK